MAGCGVNERVTEYVTYFIEESEFVTVRTWAHSAQEALELRDEEYPGKRVLEQRTWIEWREVA